MSTHPTGQQYEISFGEHVAVVTEVGATLRKYAVAGHDVIRGFSPTEVVRIGRGQQLMPWPNRIRDGLYTFEGVEHQLALSEPDLHNAIHGLVRHVAWERISHTDESITLQVTVYPQIGWTGVLQARVTHTLSDAGLQVDVEATNVGKTTVPFGYAAHPYLTVGETTVDDVEITLPASRYLEVDDRLLPVELRDVTGTKYDLRTTGALGETMMDTAFTDLALEDDDRWHVRLKRGDRHAALWAEPVFGWLQVFTGNAHRDDSIAVEPMSCGPNAWNPGPTEDGVIVLAPGDTFTGSWGVTGA